LLSTSVLKFIKNKQQFVSRVEIFNFLLLLNHLMQPEAAADACSYLR